MIKQFINIIAALSLAATWATGNGKILVYNPAGTELLKVDIDPNGKHGLGVFFAPSQITQLLPGEYEDQLFAVGKKSYYASDFRSMIQVPGPGATLHITFVRQQVDVRFGFDEEFMGSDIPQGTLSVTLKADISDLIRQLANGDHELITSLLIGLLKIQADLPEVFGPRAFLQRHLVHQEEEFWRDHIEALNRAGSEYENLSIISIEEGNYLVGIKGGSLFLFMSDDSGRVSESMFSTSLSGSPCLTRFIYIV